MQIEEQQHDVERQEIPTASPSPAAGREGRLAQQHEDDGHRHGEDEVHERPGQRDQHVPRSRRQPGGVVARVGLHRLAPGDERTAPASSAPTSGKMIVPSGSMWASGDSVSRPCRRGIRSPETVGDERVPELVDRHRDHERDQRQDRARTWSAEMPMRAEITRSTLPIHGTLTQAAGNPQISARSTGACHPSMLAGADGPPRRAGAAAARGPRQPRVPLRLRQRLLEQRIASSRRPARSAASPFHSIISTMSWRLQRQLAAPRDERVELGRPTRRPDASADPSTTSRSAAGQQRVASARRPRPPPAAPSPLRRSPRPPPRRPRPT